MKLHNLEAYVLLDSGCTSDSMSPEFATSTNLKVYELKELVPLQLGTVGSHLKINFGLFTNFGIGQVNGNHYFDVVNIDRYDAILGTMFMRKHGIVLDFEHDKVHVKGKILETIIEGKSMVKGPLTKKDIPHLREEWKTSCQDILSGVPNTLPPLREINHHIPLVDKQKRYNYHLLKCPNSMRKPLTKKISKYCKAGWWHPARVEQAALMLVIPKKSHRGKCPEAKCKHGERRDTVSRSRPHPP
ncbi:hypothetical protein L208DRAFT_1280338 [Tricholoma matsutake]|nr:hypothetical protein L208DRAFT_1280338 [Tricholoma matsutake 945]